MYVTPGIKIIMNIFVILISGLFFVNKISLTFKVNPIKILLHCAVIFACVIVAEI